MTEMGGSFFAAKAGCGTAYSASDLRAICSMYSAIAFRLIDCSIFPENSSAIVAGTIVMEHVGVEVEAIIKGLLMENVCLGENARSIFQIN